MNSLWQWFGLSRAAFLVLPRVMMHEMTDDWQERMAKLLKEYEAAFPNHFAFTPRVRNRDEKTGKYVAWPLWVLNYRHPDKEKIKECK